MPKAFTLGNLAKTAPFCLCTLNKLLFLQHTLQALMCSLDQFSIYILIIYQHFHNINAIFDTLYSQNGQTRTDVPHKRTPVLICHAFRFLFIHFHSARIHGIGLPLCKKELGRRASVILLKHPGEIQRILKAAHLGDFRNGVPLVHIVESSRSAFFIRRLVMYSRGDIPSSFLNTLRR